MLLVAILTNTKRCKKTENWLKAWHMGTHLRVLSESYPMNTNMTGFRLFSQKFIPVLWIKVAFEGLSAEYKPLVARPQVICGVCDIPEVSRGKAE